MENTKLRMRNTFSSPSNRGEIAASNRTGLAIVACVLLAVFGLVASAPTVSAANQLTLSWQSNDSTADGFKIERSGNAGSSFTEIAQVSSIQTSYIDSGLTAGVPYYYRVLAYNSAGNSDYSNVASGTVPVSAPSTAPSNSQATAVSAGQVSLSWGSVAAATGYTIERASFVTGPWTQVAIVGSGTTTYRDTANLWDNQTYYYRMRAYNSAGSSSYSTITSATTPADPYLLGHWNFDEGSGTVGLDLSGNQNGGSVSNATWITGISGRGLDFNGTDARVLVADSALLNPTDAITVALWIAPNSWAGVPRLLQKGPGPDQYRLFVRDGNLRFSLAGVNLDAPAPLPGFWYHVAGTYDGSMMKLFIDGQLVAQQTASVSMGTATGPLCIGAKSPSSGAFQFFDGAIDDVRIYGRALTATEIQNLATP
jgi:hypothetical protein